MKDLKIKVTSLKLISERTIFLGLACFSFIIPFSLGHSQFLTGTLTNSFLFLAIIFLPRRLFWPLIFLPSLAVLSRGLIFGPLTIFLIYLLPFIWLGNYFLMVVFKKINDRYNFYLSVFLAALVKGLVIFIPTFFFFKINLLPYFFLRTMGFNQFLTAILGGFMVLLFFKKFKYGKF